MRISAQEEYGLRCLLQLARSNSAMTIQEVAKKEGLSTAYVGKLFFLLRKADLVKSLRGAKGGYALAGRPQELSLGRVLSGLGAPQRKEGICQDFPGSKRECVHVHGSCSVRSVWNRIYQNIWSVLEATTLADLLQEESALNRQMDNRFLVKEIPLETGGNHVTA